MKLFQERLKKQGLTIDVILLLWEPIFSQQRLKSMGFFVYLIQMFSPSQ